MTNKITDDVNYFSYSKCKVYLKNLENNLPNLQQKYGNIKQITLKSAWNHIILKTVYNDGQCKYVIENMDIVDKTAKKKAECCRNDVMKITGRLQVT